MRWLFPFLLVCALSVSAQIPASQPTELVPITPDTVVAIVNGQKFTAGDLERITKDLSPQLRALAGSNPKSFLQQYAQTLTFAAEAEKAELQNRAPYRERIVDARNEILAKALVDEYRANLQVTPEEVRKSYETKRPNLKQARAKVIFISRMSQVSNLGDKSAKVATPEEIKAKVDSVTAAAREGADFAKLAAENSDDRATADKQADLPYPIRADAKNIPVDMRDAVVSAKPGDIVGPLEHATGYYLFRIESIEVPPFEEVRSELEDDLKSGRVQQWLAGLRSKSTVELQNDGFWQTFLAANGQQAPAPEQAKPSRTEPKPESPAVK
jgi:hypothetical protein